MFLLLIVIFWKVVVLFYFLYFKILGYSNYLIKLKEWMNDLVEMFKYNLNK